MLRIAIFGDSHYRWGDLYRASIIMKDKYGCSYGIHTGDLGFTASSFDRNMRFPFPIYAVDGNHEDHQLLSEIACQDPSLDPWSETGVAWMRRGSVMDIDGVRVGFIGGALHAHARQVTIPEIPEDKPLPLDKKNISWAQYPLDDDVLSLINNIQDRKLDLLVSHSCPSQAGIGMKSVGKWELSTNYHIKRRGLSSGPSNDLGEPSLTSLRNLLGCSLSPYFWVFGHWHRVIRHYDPFSRTEYLCVGTCDASMKSTFIPHFYDVEQGNIVVGNPESLL